MFNKTPEQFLQVYHAVCARPDLSPTAKILFIEALARVTAQKIRLPIHRLPLCKNIEPTLRFDALRELYRVKLGKKVSRSDGDHFEIEVNHPIFVEVAQPQSMGAYIKLNLPKASTAELLTVWRIAYQKQFGEPPKSDPKDLVRLRMIGKKLGPTCAFDAIHEFVLRHRQTKHKCNSLGLYLAYGRTKQ